jgi:predicted membrane chloride channel (bestrophin family)
MIVNNKAIGYHFVIIYYILFCITLAATKLCVTKNFATHAVNLTEKPFFVTSIAILVLLLIHDEIYHK